MRRRAIAVLTVLALGGMAPAGLTPDPALRYAVSGAGPLALRAGPDPGAEAATSLPAGARDLVLTGRRAEGPGGDLWEILPPGDADRPAWAPAERLAPGSPDAAPFPLQCSGTEPFWGLRLSGGQARMSRPGARDQLLAAGPRRAAAGDPRVYVQKLSGPGRTPGQVVVLRRAAGCSDGMSDLSYPYETVVTTPSGEVLSGCCRRAGG
ncbi:MAG: COG3650 family protein [Phenylobacterium sp.]